MKKFLFGKPIPVTNKDNKRIVVFRDNKFCVKSKGFVEIKDSNIVYSDTTVLYSLPINDKHPDWTERVIKKKLDNLKLVAMFWSRYKPKMKIDGYIENGYFIHTK